jgi:hypothetical protein
MHGVEKGLNELCGMLKTEDTDIKKINGSNDHMMAVQNKPNFKKGKSQKNKGKAENTVSHPVLKGKPKVNHVHARIRTHVHIDYESRLEGG